MLSEVSYLIGESRRDLGAHLHGVFATETHSSNWHFTHEMPMLALRFNPVL